jgi:hypothetical protein
LEFGVSAEKHKGKEDRKRIEFDSFSVARELRKKIQVISTP